MKYRLLFLLAALMVLPSLYTHADAGKATEINWQDLIPAGVYFDDPFEALTQDQLYKLSIVAKYQQQLANKQTISNSLKAEYEQSVTELEKENIDYDELLSKRTEIIEKRRARALAANTELNGKSIRMPGYLLPLEFKDKGVTEFLLVPWVGACIHMPPPPPNQIVHVVLDKNNAFHSKSRFEPVWVAGEMLTKSTTKNLYLNDGTSDILVSYMLQANHVERYKP
jgi:hypothetical protein